MKNKILTVGNRIMIIIESSEVYAFVTVITFARSCTNLTN